MKVLIIDDSKTIAERLGAAIGELPGVRRVDWAPDVSRAAELLRVHRPDAVVLDLQLGDQNGLDILLQFRESMPDTSFIVLTSFALPFLRRMCLRLGANHFFDKATELPQAYAVLTQLSSKAEQSGSPAL